jgi:hypothetical protein
MTEPKTWGELHSIPFVERQKWRKANPERYQAMFEEGARNPFGASEPDDGVQFGAELRELLRPIAKQLVVEGKRGADPFGAYLPAPYEYDPRAVSEWTYQDEKGDPLFKVARGPGKTFRQSPTDGNGGWLKPSQGCMDATRVVPYMLPDLQTAISNSGLILIAEGERKVDLLRHLGFTATCNVSGAVRSKLWFDHAREFFSTACYSPTIIVLGAS